jgi:hypothetical protein
LLPTHDGIITSENGWTNFHGIWYGHHAIPNPYFLIPVIMEM